MTLKSDVVLNTNDVTFVLQINKRLNFMCYLQTHTHTKNLVRDFEFYDTITLSQKHTLAPASVLSIASLLMLFVVADARIPGLYTGGQWESAHATFYGGNDADLELWVLSSSF